MRRPPDGTGRKTTGKAPPRTADLFVDAIEDGRARLLLDEESFTIPARLLPAGARAGSWIRLEAGVIPAPASRAEEIRAKLSRDDRGGPIKL